MDKVKIGKTIYELKQVDEIIDNVDGRISYPKGTIYFHNHEEKPNTIEIVEGFSDEYWAEILLHECLHGIEHELHFKLGETNINILGITLSNFLKTNPRFFTLCEKTLYFDESLEQLSFSDIMDKIHVLGATYNTIQLSKEDGQMSNGQYASFTERMDLSEFYLYREPIFRENIIFPLMVALRTIEEQFDAKIPKRLFYLIAEGITQFFFDNEELVMKFKAIYKKANRHKRLKK